MRIHIPAIALTAVATMALVPHALAYRGHERMGACTSQTDEVIVLIRHKDKEATGNIGKLVAKALEVGDAEGLAYERVPYTNGFIFRLDSDGNEEWISPREAAENLAEDVQDLIEVEGLEVVAFEPNSPCHTPGGNPSNIRILGDEGIAAIATQPGLAHLGLRTLNSETTGLGMVVAILDTGLSMEHPMFEGRIADGGIDLIDGDGDPSDERTHVDGDGDGLVDEEFGHGTFVASMVLTAAPDALILPIRVLDSEGSGELIHVAAGIIYAVEHGADVINVSASLGRHSRVLERAITIAAEMDVLVVSSTGNHGGKLGFPARYRQTIAVTAVNVDDIVPPWANTGPRCDLSAPGVNVLGAFPMDESSTGTAYWSGTSFAAPLVSGTLAALYATNPWDEASRFAEALEESAVNIDNKNPAYIGRTGKGRVRPVLALDEL